MSKINFFALGGVQENGKNLYVLEIDKSLFILDCGLKYPTSDLYGVDIIVNDIEKEEYAVLEVNSNPGIYIQRWPYEGEERRIAIEILELLEIV